MNWGALLQSAIILFAIVNPIGSIPIFLQLTNPMTVVQRRRAFNMAVGAATAILIIFILAGKGILTTFFQIQLADLMAAGGLLLIIIAIDHLIFGSLVRGVLRENEQDAEHVGAVPMACPILAGPGAMMTAFVTYLKFGFLITVSSIVIVMGITWLIFRYIDRIYLFLGRIVCTVLSKILCLFIAAIGFRLLMQGLLHYFK
jgi:multiple antibiotic resistance protein